MKNNRENYEFSRSQKAIKRQAANGACEFPGKECKRPNNGEVHHITGCYEGRLNKMTPESINNPELNAIMLCESHKWHHDEQEGLHILQIMQTIVPEHEIFNRESKKLKIADPKKVLTNLEHYRKDKAIKNTDENNPPEEIEDAIA